MSSGRNSSRHPGRQSICTFLILIGSFDRYSAVVALADDPPRSVLWAIGDQESLSPDGAMHVASELTAPNRDRVQWLLDNDEHDLALGERPDCHQDGTSYGAVYGRMHAARPAPTITTGYSPDPRPPSTAPATSATTPASHSSTPSTTHASPLSETSRSRTPRRQRLPRPGPPGGCRGGAGSVRSIPPGGCRGPSCILEPYARRPPEPQQLQGAVRGANEGGGQRSSPASPAWWPLQRQRAARPGGLAGVEVYGGGHDLSQPPTTPPGG